jgi:4-hydroxyphenylpyruvate dioxygenase
MAQQAAPAPATPPAPDHDFMPLNGIHHVELFVGNALQAAYYYAHAFGFRRVAYRGL